MSLADAEGVDGWEIIEGELAVFVKSGTYSFAW